MSVDLSNTKDLAQSRLSAIKTFKDVSQDEKQLKKDVGNSLEKAVGDSANQLNKIINQQKRFQRNVPTSMDSLFNLIFGARGSGLDTVKYIRAKLLEVMVKMEPKMDDIITNSTIKALGCSQEQTYPGLNLSATIPPFNQFNALPLTDGIFIPVKSIDFTGNLTIPLDSLIGKFYYEKEKNPSGEIIPFTTTTKSLYKPYGGYLKIPMNRVLKERINSTGVFYSRDISTVYKGVSQQNLFDISYVNTNGFGVSGDYFRIFLINRDDPAQQGVNDYKKNKIGQFLKDYFKTIKKVDPVSVTASLVNYLTHCVDINIKVGYERASDNNKFSLILQRILGLCFDSRREIDVSGTGKIAELDGVDDSFFEFTEIELRNIDEIISDIQNGVITYEDCGNIKLPVNTNSIINNLINFSNSSATTVHATVKNIENIIDDIAKNPQWRLLIPNSVDIDLAINKQVLKDLPKAVAFSVLSPKVLLPLFLLIQVVEQSAKNETNSLIQSGNTIIQSGNSFLQTGTTTGQNVINLINSSVDFAKKFKSFVIEVVSKINAIFLEELYAILKRDIIKLLSDVIKDINKSAKYKKYSIIIRFLQIALAISQLINDYRKCKSLFDSVLQLLNLINGAGSALGIKKNIVPLPLLQLASLLPGTSPERMAINVIENLDKLGIPTGRGPGNKANLMNQFMLQMFKGMDKENADNGKVEITLDSTGVFGYGKHI